MTHADPTKPSVSVVVPALDEPYLETLKSMLHRILGLYCYEYEIIVRDDPGCGNAILNGIRVSKHDIVAVMDGDGSHDPVDVPYMVSWLNEDGLDVVYGRKWRSDDTWYRKLVTLGFDYLTRILLWRNQPDLMSGFFVFRKSRVTLPETIDHPKVLMRIVRDSKDIKLKFVPIRFHARVGGESKLGSPSVAHRIVCDLVRRNSV